MASKKPATLNGGQAQLIQSGDYVDPAALGSGSPSATTVLCGDSSYKTFINPAASTSFADWNTPTDNGFIQLINGASNQPTSGSNWAAISVQGVNANNIGQLAIPVGTNQLWMRSKLATVWGSWARIYTAADSPVFAGSVTTPLVNLVPGTAPGSPANGDIWYDSGLAKFRKREAGVTSDIGATGAAGTVTNVTWVTADGVTASIATSTTTPAITINLGDITPTGVDILGTGTHGDLTGSGSSNSLRIATTSTLGSIALQPNGLGSSTNCLTLDATGGISRDTTPAAGDNSTEIATTAYVRSNVGMANYRILLDRTGSHIAARTAAHYAIPQGNPCAISGTGTLYSQGVFYFDPADYPTVDTVTAKLRIRGQVFVNNVAPTGNFIIGMYPVTRPASSGGAGLNIYTLGTVTAVCTTVTAPAADSMNTVTSSDFAMPAAGWYCLGVQTTATVAASSHLHINAQLQMRHA